MKIQITSLYYHPENFRINDIAASLVQRGHEVRVLTALPDYSTGRVPPAYRWGRRRREVIEGVTVRRVPLFARRTGLLARIVNYASFTATMSLYALFTRQTRFDVILCNMTSPIFQTLPAVLYKRRTGKRLVMYCYDIWPECLKAWNVREDSALFRAVRRISSWLYRQCDVVAITSRPFRGYLTEVCGVPDNRIVYLPQYAEDTYSDIVGHYEENGCIDFLFAGNLGAVQNVDCILRAAALVQTTAPFCIHIVGDGSEFAALQALAGELLPAERVRFYGRRPLAEMKAFYTLADCFLLTLRGGDFIGMTLPGKAQGYLCAGKPVLAAIDGAGRELVEEAGCGEAVPAGDAPALAEKMQAMIEDFAPYRAKGLAGRRYYEQHFTRETFLASLETILEDTAHE